MSYQWPKPGYGAQHNTQLFWLLYDNECTELFVDMQSVVFGQIAAWNYIADLRVAVPFSIMWQVSYSIKSVGNRCGRVMMVHR